MRPVVLVVDDDRDTRDALEQLLALEELDVRLAADGAEALRLLEQGLSPCLVLLDLTMPHLDGWAVMDELRRRGLSQQVPVIVATASTGPRPPDGVIAVFHKPYSIERLLGVLRSHCNRPASGHDASPR
jgi:CheY-like chemotaxis protein